MTKAIKFWMLCVKYDGNTIEYYNCSAPNEKAAIKECKRLYKNRGFDPNDKNVTFHAYEH